MVAISGMPLLGFAADPWAKPASIADSLLPVDQAFELVSAERAGGAVQVNWSIAPGYYLYRQRLGFDSIDQTPAAFGTARLPTGALIEDEHLGKTEIYRGTLVANLPLRPGATTPHQLRVRYQGCADAGVCYPPQTRVIDIVSSP